MRVHYGVSGELMFSTGTTHLVVDLDQYQLVLVFLFAASRGDGGDITTGTKLVMASNTLDGGHVSVFAGKTDAGGTTGATGGSISIRSGFSTESSSGTIIIRTLNAGAKGVSGEIDRFTTCGGSGSISIGTGTACNGDGGDIM